MSTFANTDIYTMESANLFAGAAPTNTSDSLHLSLTELKLPGFDQQFVDHRAAGSMVSIEIDTVFAKLESTFVLAGWTPQVAELLAQWTAQQQTFTAYGNIRDRSGGNPYQAVAIMWGKLGHSDPANWQRGQVQHWNYAIKGIIHYELWFDGINGEQIYYFDFFTNIFNVGGVSVMDSTNRNLNIPTVATAPTTPGGGTD